VKDRRLPTRPSGDAFKFAYDGPKAFIYSTAELEPDEINILDGEFWNKLSKAEIPSGSGGLLCATTIGGGTAVVSTHKLYSDELGEILEGSGEPYVLKRWRPPTAREISPTARELVSYLTFRAEREGVSMELTEQWIEDRLREGYHTFFGIHVDQHGIVRDDQNPTALAEWSRSPVIH
jgi:hypothetical protein